MLDLAHRTFNTTLNTYILGVIDAAHLSSPVSVNLQA